jgi:methylenetetrahydrofolate reductase (NADPH)
MAIASHAQKYLGVDVLLHLTAQGMPAHDLKRHLQQAKTLGIQNLLVLRGDPPRAKPSWLPGDVSGGDCPRAIDLVNFIRQEYGDFFGLAVAGHPEGHPSSTSTEEEIRDLKDKLAAGADFIVTQFIYDVDKFLAYVKMCRSAGITCPIIPGIMPIQSYNSFIHMTDYCNVSVPDSIRDQLVAVKNDDEAVKEIGCQVAVDMCKRILKESNGDVDGVHFYTLNLERSVTRILMQMGVVDWIEPKLHSSGDSDNQIEQRRNRSPSLSEIGTRAGRVLPWRPSAMQGRSQTEDVRPINWANRPKSYVMRTEDWDEFPNG